MHCLHTSPGHHSISVNDKRGLLQICAKLGPVTRWSRLEKRRDETRRDRLDLVSSRDFVSRDGLELKFLSRKKNTGQKVKI